MKRSIHLTASVDKPDLLEDLVEDLVARNPAEHSDKPWVPAPWKAIETSGTETYLSGNVEFDYDEESRIRIPYITCFVFMCVKQKADPFKLTWSMSLN